MTKYLYLLNLNGNECQLYLLYVFVFEIFIFEVLIILIKLKKKTNFVKSCRRLSKARTEICALDLVIKVVLGTLIKISVN